jgi:hypothetical protein
MSWQFHGQWRNSRRKNEEKYTPGLVAQLWQITKLEWTVLPHPQTSSCSLRLPPLWSPQRCHPWEKVWEWWRGCWRSGCECRIQTGTVQDGGDTCSCFSLAQGCWSWWRLCRKIMNVVNTASYPMSMLEELYNKLRAIKNCIAKLFG